MYSNPPKVVCDFVLCQNAKKLCLFIAVKQGRLYPRTHGASWPLPVPPFLSILSIPLPSHRKCSTCLEFGTWDIPDGNKFVILLFLWYVICKSSTCLQLVAQPQVPLLMDCVVVRASGLWSRGRQFDSRPFHCRVAKVNSAFHPSGLGRWIEYPSVGWGSGVRTGCVHLCRVAGNTVWSHMASDVPLYSTFKTEIVAC